MTHVIRHTRTGHQGDAVSPVTLPAAPWEAGEPYSPRRRPQKPKGPRQGIISEEAVLAVLVASQGPETIPDIGRAAKLSENTTRNALRRLERAGRVVRQRKGAPGVASLWTHADA